VADLEYTIADGIGTILLNRPHRKNAFTLEMIDEWARILTEARTDPDVRVIVLTGDFIDAEEAARLGTANHVVDDDDLPAAVNTLARKLADAPPVAVRMIKRAVYQSARADLRTSLDLISSHMAVVTSTQDSAEALAAFREKRPGRYAGH